jgi:hypothetical protein
LQITAEMRLVHASLGGKSPAASCSLYLFPPPQGKKVAGRRLDGATWTEFPLGIQHERIST